MPGTDDPWGNGGSSGLTINIPRFGVDLHPVNQAGLDLGKAIDQGVAFVSVKVSEGTSDYWAAKSSPWVQLAKARGVPVVGYHYQRPGNEDAQAKLFAAALGRLGIPGVLDSEALAVDGTTPTLTIGGIRLLLARAAVYGADIRALYLPFWYWDRIGRPSLAGMPPLWASSYPSSATGTPAQLYAGVTPSRWASYGGGQVAILQFAETGSVAGYSPVDVNAYLGTRAQLAALLGVPTDPPPREAVRMRQLHLTNTGADLADLSGVLTIDPVGASAVMPAGSRAWLQWSGACVRNTSAKARVWWLVERHADGTHLDIGPFDVGHGRFGARELSKGTVAVEIGLEKVPPGFAFAAHLDGIGHA